ncbi:MAG: aldehyde-activating protein [Ponticaulis sp.]|nr:aldehyde-activating protein [Ponticaulis sp.]|tara:strand:- start:21566 stop:22063 length:498 start_codon:yes stop_codon:yes gene_type:complete
MNHILTAEGGCTCKKVRYRLINTPLFTHACHCHWCQRETGSAFVINAMIETRFVERLKGDPIRARIPSESGRGQLVARCQDCKTALWSHYTAGDVLTFLRVGTLDNPNTFPPDVHIFTRSKQSWFALNDGKPQCEAFYQRDELWPESALSRFSAMSQNPLGEMSR